MSKGGTVGKCLNFLNLDTANFQGCAGVHEEWTVIKKVLRFAVCVRVRTTPLQYMHIRMKICTNLKAFPLSCCCVFYVRYQYLHMDAYIHMIPT